MKALVLKTGLLALLVAGCGVEQLDYRSGTDGTGGAKVDEATELELQQLVTNSNLCAVTGGPSQKFNSAQEYFDQRFKPTYAALDATGDVAAFGIINRQGKVLEVSLNLTVLKPAIQALKAQFPGLKPETFAVHLLDRKFREALKVLAEKAKGACISSTHTVTPSKTPSGALALYVSVSGPKPKQHIELITNLKKPTGLALLGEGTDDGSSDGVDSGSDGGVEPPANPCGSVYGICLPIESIIRIAMYVIEATWYSYVYTYQRAWWDFVWFAVIVVSL